jgi:hypothetical protein
MTLAYSSVSVDLEDMGEIRLSFTLELPLMGEDRIGTTVDDELGDSVDAGGIKVMGLTVGLELGNSLRVGE